MEVFLSGEVLDLAHAKQWFNDRALARALGDLEQAVASREAAWGAAAVFVECTFPKAGSGKAAQVDLLVAFAGRVSLCEIKRKPLSTADKINAGSQIQAQLDCLGKHLRALGHERPAIFPFLWATLCGIEQLRETLVLLHDNRHWRHIVPAGARENLVGLTLAGEDRDSGLRAYLPEAIVQRLALADAAPSRSAGTGMASDLAAVLRRSYAAAETPLLQFGSFAAARDYLRSTLPKYDIALVPEPTFVPRLRPDVLRAARTSLLQSRFVHVAGPHGVGKTTLIKEVLVDLLNAAGRRFGICSLVLRNRRSVPDILEGFAAEAGIASGEARTRLDEDGLFSRLADTEFVYWIRDYDRVSAPALGLFVHRLRRAARRHSAYWIVESMIASDASASQSDDTVYVPPLDTGDVATILTKHPPAERRLDVNAVASAARGIPRIAIWTWILPEGNGLPRSGRLDAYDVFLHQGVAPAERPLVVAIAYILSRAPLGATLRLLEHWCAAIGGASSPEVRERVRRVVAKAAAFGLIGVECFGSADAVPPRADDPANADVDAFIRTLVPRDVADAGIGWIQVLDPHFVEHFADAIPPGERDAWDARLHEALLAGADDDLSLTGITFSLLHGDFEPFVRSSFRTSSAVLPRLAAWLDASADPYRMQAANPDGAYFRTWLRFVLDHYWDTTPVARPDAAPVPPAPDRTRPLQVLLFDTLKARGLTAWTGRGYDWNAWNTVADEFRRAGDADLWAETVLRQAQAKLRPPENAPQETWRLMKSVLEAEQSLSAQAGRPMLYFHVLSLLNKRKMLQRQMPSLESQAVALAPRLSAAMIRCGMAMENPNTIANALFFLARSIEVRNRPTTPEEVDHYTSIMRTVQRVSPARRVQALLTEGSIHRHYCAREGLAWDDFRDHAEEALRVFDRAFHSAARARMVNHAKDAVAYEAMLLIKALRFGSHPEVEPWVAHHAPRVLSDVRALMDEHRADEEPVEPGEIDGASSVTLTRSRALLGWLAAVAARGDGDEARGLGEEFTRLVREVGRRARTLPHADRVKEYQQLVVDLRRSLSYSSAPAGLAERVLDPLVDLLREVAVSLPADPGVRARVKLFKEARRLADVLRGTGVVLPGDVDAAFPRPAPGGAASPSRAR